MFDHVLHSIPTGILKFALVVLFSLLIGLEQRRKHIKEEFESLFGTDRTFTLNGILGFILYVINPQTLVPFLCGGGAITVLLAIYYYQKINLQKQYGVTTLIIALITYCLAPLIYTQPEWLVLLIVISVLIITELKQTLFEFSQKFDNGEFITLAKYLVIAGVVLPLLPDKPISDSINISPFKFWLAIVAISGISYFSYLLKKFVFPQSGIILTGILGGLYSSTATTIILAKKSKESPQDNKVMAAIILATSMMFIRIFLLALFFNPTIAMKLAPSFSILVIASVVMALFFLKFQKAGEETGEVMPSAEIHSNPLELKTASVFAVLFIFFAFITEYVIKNYGTGGINILSLVVGVTDIDPFILNLFQSKWNVADAAIVMAVVNAVSSNNLIKMIYAISLGAKSIRLKLALSFGIIVIIGWVISFVYNL